MMKFRYFLIVHKQGFLETRHAHPLARSFNALNKVIIYYQYSLQSVYSVLSNIDDL